MSKSFLNHNAGSLGPNFSGEEVAKIKSVEMLLRFDSLLSEAIAIDAKQSWNRGVGSQKVVPNCAELPFGFDRIKFLPSCSDKQQDPDGEATFVKLPNNILFGVRELYAFVPNQSSELYRDADFQIAQLAAVVCFGDTGEKTTYLITPLGVSEISELGVLAETLGNNLSPLDTPLGRSVTSEQLDRLHMVTFNSVVIDQTDREPLVDA